MFIALVFAVPVDDGLASMTIRYALFMITLHPLLCRFRFSVHLRLNICADIKPNVLCEFVTLFWQCVYLIRSALYLVAVLKYNRRERRK